MNIKLRQHQQEAMNLALKSFADGLHKINISMTTGSGKTITALSIADNFIKENGNAAVLYLSRYRLSVEQIKHRLGGFMTNSSTILSEYYGQTRDSNILLSSDDFWVGAWIGSMFGRGGEDTDGNCCSCFLKTFFPGITACVVEL